MINALNDVTEDTTVRDLTNCVSRPPYIFRKKKNEGKCHLPYPHGQSSVQSNDFRTPQRKGGNSLALGNRDAQIDVIMVDM